jgi:hypothetical protein
LAVSDDRQYLCSGVTSMNERRRDVLCELVALGPLPEQCGIVVSHGRRVVSADIFGDPELLGAHYEALVTAALLEIGAVAEGQSISVLGVAVRAADREGCRYAGAGHGAWHRSAHRYQPGGWSNPAA